MDFSETNRILSQIAKSLDSMTAQKPNIKTLEKGDVFIWNADRLKLELIEKVNFTDISLLKAIEQSKKTLLDNTKQFADGYSANNILLWGARGMGKSSLVKSAFAAINQDRPKKIALIEIHREDIASLPLLISVLKKTARQIIIFCDDLSFDDHDSSYKSLKAVLEGGVEGRPANILFYATSNRRHLISRDMEENNDKANIRPKETADEKISLSDRFGLWLGFYSCSQDDYLKMIDAYIEHYNLQSHQKLARKESLIWAVTRGARSGRVAYQYICDLAGRLQVRL